MDVLSQSSLPEGPDAWYAQASARFDHDDLDDHVLPDLQPRTFEELIDQDGAALRALHAGLVADAIPKPAAATYLAGWFAGGLARIVGLGLGTAGAGVLPRADRVQFHCDAMGWPGRIEPGVLDAVVGEGHPWAGRPGVRVVAPSEVVPATMAGLIELVSPLITVCRAVANVKLANLWDEVADGFGGALAFQMHTPITPGMLNTMQAALDLPDAPWGAKPRLGYSVSADCGPVHVMQRGGCCLAFTARRAAPADESAADDEPDQQPPHLAALLAEYQERFPVDPAAKEYCSTCKFRDPADVDARQLFWQEVRARGVQP